MLAACATQAAQAAAPQQRRSSGSSSGRLGGFLPAAARPLAAPASGSLSGSPLRACSQQQPARQRRGQLLVTAATKVSKGKQILCNKTMKAKEGEAKQVAKLCAGVSDFSKERMTDRRSGVLAFDWSEDDFEPGTFHFMELYSSQRAMADHAAAPEISKFVDQVAGHLEGPMGMVLYEYTNGKIGPACMEGEVKGEGGLDDATGTNRFGGGASMKQTSASVDLTSIKEKDDDEKGLWGMKGFDLGEKIKEIKLPFKLPILGGKKKKE